MGVLDSPNDGGSGWHPISTYQQTIRTLRTNYPNFGSIMGWEYWDAGIGDNFTDPWTWVARIGESVFGSVPEGKADLVSEPISTVTYTLAVIDGNAHWPRCCVTGSCESFEHLQWRSDPGAAIIGSARIKSDESDRWIGSGIEALDWDIADILSAFFA